MISVGLFVTCLVDLHRPNVGFAAIALLEEAGCTVEVPDSQVCCGQPAYNSGDDGSTIKIAKQVITAFERFQYVVVPSGSCASMIVAHYPELFSDDAIWLKRAEDLAGRSHELFGFLVDIMKVDTFSAEHVGDVTYHDACSGLRDLGIKDQPRQLMSNVSGLSLVEMEDTDVCCGFGGTFCVKFPDISERMVSDKAALVKQSGARTLLGGDMGCLLNISGRLSRVDANVRVFHLAEVLAGMTDVPAIGEGAGTLTDPATKA